LSDTGGAPPAATPFGDRLAAAVAARESQVVLGIDPDTTKLWPDAVEAMAGSRERLVHALDDAERSTGLGGTDPTRDIRLQAAAAVLAHCLALVDAAGPACVAVKPQLAHFERLGFAGLLALEATVAHARAQDLLVIADVKRGDIASTAEAYARAFLSGVPGCDRECLCDAVTLNAFLGEDSVSPFLEACAESGGGLYVLVRTSNRGSRDFQRHGEPELSFAIAAAVERWGSELVGQCGWSSIGAVVGATHGDELRAFRAALPRTPLLLPGYGAQGAGADDVVGAFRSADGARAAPTGALVNSSRGISFAYRSDARHADDWRAASRAALEAMIDDLARAIGREP
jgi:orotidine-5'-phosphate decarboxylase